MFLPSICFESQTILSFKGTDITEAFEIHHLNRGKAEHLLQEFRVREAKLPRNFKFTFKETGFYRTLQRRIADELKQIDTKQDEFFSKVWNFPQHKC